MFGGTGNVFGQKAAPQLPFVTGAPASSGGLFAAPATTQQQPTVNFNFPAAATAQPAAGFSFPQTQPQQTGFAPAGQPTLFGESQIKPAAAPPSLSFGTPTVQPNLSFGITPTTPATTGLSFGLTPASSATTTGFSLGLGATTATASTGLGFGLPSTAPAPTTAPALNFNLGSNTTASTLGTQLPTFGIGTTTAQQTFNLGSSLTTTTASQPILNFSLSKPSATTTPSFGLATTTATTAPAFGLGVPSVTTASTTLATGTGAITSLGKPSEGVNPLSSLTTLDVARADKSDSAKDQPVHQELINCLNNLREVIKTQKRHSSELARGSVKPFLKVKQDAETLKRMIGQVERDLNTNKAMNKKFKSDLDRSVVDAETLHRLIDNPRVFPCDNSLAFEYFQNIIERFQEQAETLSTELKNMERHVGCRMNPPIPFTPEELAASMKRLYECFVALAGRYQSIHSSITALKLEVKRRKDSMCK